MFASKARAYPSGAPQMSSTKRSALGLTYKPLTSLERLAANKHSSLLRTFVKYGRKRIYYIEPCITKHYKCVIYVKMTKIEVI